MSTWRPGWPEQCLLTLTVCVGQDYRSRIVPIFIFCMSVPLRAGYQRYKIKWLRLLSIPVSVCWPHPATYWSHVSSWGNHWLAAPVQWASSGELCWNWNRSIIVWQPVSHCSASHRGGPGTQPQYYSYPSIHAVSSEPSDRGWPAPPLTTTATSWRMTSSSMTGG